METIVFVTRLPKRARDDLRRQAFANGRTMASEARVIIEDALGFDRRVVADEKPATQKGGQQ